MPSFIEYNDWQIRVFDSQGATVYEDIAAAVNNNGELQFGSAAWRQSRSQPQRFNNRYFANLNADPIATDMGSAKNHADLIYHHLRQLPIAAEQSVVLSVPGYFSNTQLGVLMGICQEAGLQIAGFVDMALAMTLPCLQQPQNPPITNDIHLLDLEQHRLSLTRLQIDGEELVQQQTRTFDGLGLLSIIDGWMNLIADNFVQKTRFDPTHTGACEQQMLDQVFDWFSQPARDPRISIEHGGTQREIEINEKELQDKLQQRLQPLEVADISTLVLTRRAQSVPGLAGMLQQQVPRLLELDDADTAQSYLHLSRQLQDDAVARIQRTPLPAQQGPVTAPASQPPAVAAEPTHLLHEHTAYALTEARFADHLPRLNMLQTGEEITLSGLRYVAIRVT